MKETFFFAHGNGFPSLCYSEFLKPFRAEGDCYWIEKIGHDPRFPVTDNWEHLVSELISSVKSQCDGPVIGIGHSLGGVLTLLAAISEPSLYKAVVMLDSPLLGRIKSAMIRFAKSFGVIDQITPALRTRSRRTIWPSRHALKIYLQSRPLFYRFTSQCLEDYIEFGAEETKDGWQLKFDREIETNIFRTIPHQLPNNEGLLKVPGLFFYGEDSYVVTPSDRRYMEKKYGIKNYKIPGTHMFPMEYPEIAAQSVLKALAK